MAGTIQVEQPKIEREKDRQTITEAFFPNTVHRKHTGGVVMVSIEQLEKMQNAKLNTEEVDALLDISEVSIQGETSLERLESLLQQINNPYYFRVGKTPVRITFDKNGAPLEEKLKAHFLSLKQNT